MPTLINQKKLQLSRTPVVVGVTYDLIEMVLQIKEDRKKELNPGSAGKLRKLMFGASQVCKKVGRAFLRSISERQYARSPLEDSFQTDEALELSLKQWRKLIE